jgi:hypothetical protein
MERMERKERKERMERMERNKRMERKERNKRMERKERNKNKNVCFYLFAHADAVVKIKTNNLLFLWLH